MSMALDFHLTGYSKNGDVTVSCKDVNIHNKKVTFFTALKL